MKRGCHPSACQAGLPVLELSSQTARGCLAPGTGWAELVLAAGCSCPEPSTAGAPLCTTSGHWESRSCSGQRGEERGSILPARLRLCMDQHCSGSCLDVGMHGAARLQQPFVTLPGYSRPFATCFICLPALTWHQTGVKLLNHFKIVLIFCFVLISTAPINQLTGPGS